MEYDIRIMYSANNEKSFRDLHFKNESEANDFFEKVINGKGFVEAINGIWINSNHVIEISEPETIG